MSDTLINIRPLEKNGVTLTPTFVEIKRGAAKSTKYPIIQVPITKEDQDKQLATLIEYAKFRGPSVVAKALNSIEKQDGQQALESAGDWEENPTGETGKDGKPVVSLVLNSVDEDKYYTNYLAESMRGGETLDDMDEEIADLTSKIKALMFEFVQPSTDATRKVQCVQESSELTIELQNVEERKAQRQANFANRKKKGSKNATADAVTA